MGKRTIPATEAVTVYDCDGGCGKTDLPRGYLDVFATVQDRDYQGEVVYAHDVVFCQGCARELRAFLADRGGSL